MNDQSSQFGSDQQTARNVFEIMLLIIGLIVIGWFRVNTTLWQTAEVFWFIGLTATVGVIAAFVVKKSPIDFDVPIAEKPVAPIPKKLLYVVFTVLGFATFFIMSQTSYRIAAPKFQVLDPGLEGNVVLSFFAAIFENNLFFVLLSGIIFSVVYWKTRNAYISMIPVLLIVPGTFLFYHWNVYGVESADSWAVLLFGAEMIAAMVVLRNVTYVHVRHIANNLGILVFEAMGVQTFFITLMSQWLFWAFVILAIIYVVYRIKKR
jgi:hypothetical protein